MSLSRHTTCSKSVNNNRIAAAVFDALTNAVVNFHRITAALARPFLSSSLFLGMNSAKNKVITFPWLWSLLFLLFPRLRAAFSILASLLFACQPTDFLPPFREIQRCILLTRTCAVPRSRKHLGVLLPPFQCRLYIFFSVYLSIRTTPMQPMLKLYYAWGMENNEKHKG